MRNTGLPSSQSALWIIRNGPRTAILALARTHSQPACAEYFRPVNSFPFSFLSCMKRQVRFSVPERKEEKKKILVNNQRHDNAFSPSPPSPAYNSTKERPVAMEGLRVLYIAGLSLSVCVRLSQESRWCAVRDAITLMPHT